MPISGNWKGKTDLKWIEALWKKKKNMWLAVGGCGSAKVLKKWLFIGKYWLHLTILHSY